MVGRWIVPKICTHIELMNILPYMAMRLSTCDYIKDRSTYKADSLSKNRRNFFTVLAPRALPLCHHNLILCSFIEGR